LIDVKAAPDPSSRRADAEAKIKADAHKQDVAALNKRIKELEKAGVQPDDPLLASLLARRRRATSPEQLAAHDEGVIEIRKQEIAAAAKKGSTISPAREGAIKEELGLREVDVAKIIDIPGFTGRLMNRNTGDLLPGTFNHKDHGQNISRLHRLILDTANTYSHNQKVSTIQGISYAIETLKSKQAQINALLDQYKEAQTLDDFNKLQELQNKRDPITRHPLIRYMSIKQDLELNKAEADLAKDIAQKRVKDREYDLENVDEPGGQNIPDKQAAAPTEEKGKGPGMIDTAIGAVKTQARETYNLLDPKTQQLAKKIRDKLLSIFGGNKQPNNQQGN
jgi:hypothetical protein